MNPPKTLVALGFVIIAIGIVYGFVATRNGDVDLFFSLAWAQVSMIDLYTGLLLFSGWVIYREQSWGRSLVWIILLLVLGNLISCLYVFLALRESRGNWPRFWQGRRALGTS